MPRDHQRRSLVLLGALALLLAACGGGKDADEVSKDTSKPVEDQLGFETAGILERQGKVEELIRDCMKAQGFEYTPVDPNAERATLTGSANLSEDDFVKQFGYGITTLYEQRRALATKGPNAEYKASLPPAQQAAYDKALYGKSLGVTFSSAIDSGDFADLGGCTKEATEKAFGGAQNLSTLQAKLDQLDEQIAADARMVNAVKGWADCMREAGYPGLKDPDEVDQRLEDKLEEIVGPTPRNGIPFSTKPYDKAALAALQKEEVKMVRADVKCEEDNIEEVEKKVRPEYEKRFQEENASLLGSIPKA